QNLAGLSLAVAVNDEIIWAEGFGLADLPQRSPVTPQQRFRIGTAATPFTATAVGLLLDQGRLRLDDDIRTYVPTFPAQTKPITIRHLLGHLSGMRNDGGDESPLYGQSCQRPLDALPHFSGLSLRAEPGASLHFSSYGYILLAAAVESAAQIPFAQFLRQHIFQPLHMQDTLPEPSGQLLPQQALSYFPRFAADPTYGLDPMRDLDYSCFLGASGLVSTPSDLLRFSLAVHHQRLLSPAALRHGAAWKTDTLALPGESTKVIFQNGDILGGRAATIFAIPSRHLHIAVLSNTSYADTYTIATTLAQSFASAAPAKSLPAR
ncbi:serine hydrolase domain-containing protein, partial [Nostoc sp. NIES-2111]